jgi:glutaminase
MTEPEISRQIDARLEDLYQGYRSLAKDGAARYYTPGRGYHEAEPGRNDASDFGIALAGLDGEVHCAGVCDVPFALQSIAKVFTYALALDDHGREHVMTRVGVEPSGESFTSIVFDERGRRPHNPMVNAGALAAVDLVRGADVAAKRERVLAVMRRYAGNDSLDVSWDIYEREMQATDRNRGIAYLMRSEGMLDGEGEEILALYLQLCSVLVTCRDLAVMAATLANGGVNPITGDSACTRRHVRDVLSVMYTCGMYDFAGEWAFEVGVPAKSGVSGGILAPIPGKLGIAIFSPGLDQHGNSVRGVKVCQEISGRLGLHAFASDEEDAMLAMNPPAPALD